MELSLSQELCPEDPVLSTGSLGLSMARSHSVFLSLFFPSHVRVLWSKTQHMNHIMRWGKCRAPGVWARARPQHKLCMWLKLFPVYKQSFSTHMEFTLREL